MAGVISSSGHPASLGPGHYNCDDYHQYSHVDPEGVSRKTAFKGGLASTASYHKHQKTYIKPPPSPSRLPGVPYAGPNAQSWSTRGRFDFVTCWGETQRNLREKAKRAKALGSWPRGVLSNDHRVRTPVLGVQGKDRSRFDDSGMVARTESDTNPKLVPGLYDHPGHHK